MRSPSFTLVNEYRTDGLLLVHADLYRLDTAEGVEALGLEDALSSGDAALLVEWPDRWAFPPEDALKVELRVFSEDRRSLTFRPGGPQSEGVAARVLANLEAGECPGVERVELCSNSPRPTATPLTEGGFKAPSVRELPSGARLREFSGGGR